MQKSIISQDVVNILSSAPVRAAIEVAKPQATPNLTWWEKICGFFQRNWKNILDTLKTAVSIVNAIIGILNYSRKAAPAC